MEGQKLHKLLTSALSDKEINPEKAIKVSVIVGGKYVELDVEDLRFGYPPGETNEETYLVIVTPQSKEDLPKRR